MCTGTAYTCQGLEVKLIPEPYVPKIGDPIVVSEDGVEVRGWRVIGPDPSLLEHSADHEKHQYVHVARADLDKYMELAKAVRRKHNTDHTWGDPKADGIDKCIEPYCQALAAIPASLT